MRLIARCKQCKSNVAFNTFEETRADYAKHKGKIVVLTCKNCGIESQFHINEFHAKSIFLRILSYKVLFLGYGLMALPFLFPETYEYIYAFFTESIGRIVVFGLIPSTIFGIIQKAALRKEHAYNSYKVKQ